MSELNTATSLPLAAVSALCEGSAPPTAIYLPTTGKDAGVLFCNNDTPMQHPDFERLQVSGVTHLMVECDDLARHEAELEQNLSSLLRNPRMDPVQKAVCVRHFGMRVAHDLAAGHEVAETVDRANVVLDAIVENVLSNQTACESLLSMCGHHRSTASHMFAVSTLAILLGNEVFGNDAARLRRIGLAGMIHDLGKKSVPADVLLKSTPLTPDEMDLLRHHPIESIRLLGDESTVPGDVRLMVLQHHERYDGTGYPLGIAGPDLLVESRILTIVDSFHAMIGRRDYRRPLSPARAIDLMKHHVGKQFDPALFAHWERMVRHNWRLLDKQTMAADQQESVGAGFHADHGRLQPRKYARIATRHDCGGRLIVPVVYSGRLSHLDQAPDVFHPRVTDLSKSGLCFTSSFPFYRGEVVNVRISQDGPEHWVRGLIRWCRRGQQQSSFRTGIQFIERISPSATTERVAVMPYESGAEATAPTPLLSN